MRWIVSLWQSIWAAISFVPQWLLARALQRKPQLFRYVRVDEFPDALERLTIYLAGEGDHLWAAAMICPCGCGESIDLNLLGQIHPSWRVQEHEDGLVSLAPSVWRQKGCRSHFLVQHGRITWC